MNIDRAGYPFVLGALVPAVALAAAERFLWAAPLLLVAVALALFFRDPERHTPDEPGIVVSPADGRVVVAGAPQPFAAPPGDWAQVSIFLSPLDVHVNRVPVSGRIAKVDYRPGAWRAAYTAEAATENERNEIWIEGDGGPVVCRQITGVLVRRVVCRVTPGERVRAGDRLGVMKFGSRIDLFLPSGSRVIVGVGERVRAGESILARLSGPSPTGDGRPR